MNIKKDNKDYEQLYAHKFDNLDETNHFLERHNLPKATWEETDNLNRPTSIREIESIIYNVPKTPAPYAFTDVFYQTFKKVFQFSTNSSGRLK